MELQAAELKIIEQRPDGSGVIEIPVMTTADEVDFAKTAGGGKKGSITDAMLDEIAGNFGNFPGPVPLGAAGVDAEGHVEYGDRSGPQLGFFESVRRAGGQLWATLDLGPSLFGLVVRDRAFRGFSVELRRDLELATTTLGGWALVGGIFTNRTGLDVNFRIAAEGEMHSSETAIRNVRLDVGDKGEKMSEVKTIALASHEAKVAELSAKIEDGQKALASARDEVDSLRKQVAELTSQVETITAERDGKSAHTIRLESQVKALNDAKDTLAKSVEELSSKVNEAEKKSLTIEVTKVVQDTIEAGVPPAVFGEWENDPAGWLNAKFASIDSLREFCTNLSGVPVKVPTVNPKSGHSPSKAAKEADEEEKALTPEQEAHFKRLGLKPIYAGVDTEEEAKARLEASAKAE